MGGRVLSTSDRPFLIWASEELDIYIYSTYRYITSQHYYTLHLNFLPLTGLRWLSLAESVDRFAVFMASQLDLSHEARNLDRFRRNFAQDARDAGSGAGSRAGSGAGSRGGDPPHGINFPRPLRAEGLVAPTVLVEEFAEGTPLSVLMARAQGGAEACALEIQT